MATIVQCNCGAEYRRTEEKFLVPLGLHGLRSRARIVVGTHPRSHMNLLNVQTESLNTSVTDPIPFSCPLCLGGWPFAGQSGAAGNIATEELVLLCERLGIETGIDLRSVSQAGHVAETTVGHELPSKLLRSNLGAQS